MRAAMASSLWHSMTTPSLISSIGTAAFISSSPPRSGQAPQAGASPATLSNGCTRNPGCPATRRDRPCIRGSAHNAGGGSVPRPISRRRWTGTWRAADSPRPFRPPFVIDHVQRAAAAYGLNWHRRTSVPSAPAGSCSGPAPCRGRWERTPGCARRPESTGCHRSCSCGSSNGRVEPARDLERVLTRVIGAARPAAPWIHVQKHGRERLHRRCVKPVRQRHQRARVAMRIDQEFVGIDGQAPMPAAVFAQQKPVQPIHAEARFLVAAMGVPQRHVRLPPRYSRPPSSEPLSTTRNCRMPISW